MSRAQTPFPTASDRCEQLDQTAAVGRAWPDELETPVSMTFTSISARTTAVPAAAKACRKARPSPPARRVSDEDALAGEFRRHATPSSASMACATADATRLRA